MGTWTLRGKGSHQGPRTSGVVAKDQTVQAAVLGIRVWGFGVLGFGVLGFWGFGVLGFWGLGFRVWGSWFGV